MDYCRFTARDFAADEYFQRWVHRPDTATNMFWQVWVDQHPDKAYEIRRAREIILELEFQDEHEPDVGRKEEMWKVIMEANDAFDATQVLGDREPGQVRSLVFPRWMRAAAVASLLFLAGIGTVMHGRYGYDTIEQITYFGETKSIVLPDSSTVVLNANSRIYYSNEWDGKDQREVWLDGEAYFSVVHTRTHQKFIVHTSENVNVEVLGTTFDVLRRADRTRVVLNSGSIKLNVSDNDKHEEILMKPGELLEFEDEPLAYVKKTTRPEYYSSWTENKMTFDGTPLSELAMVLKENYGLEVVFSDSALLNQKLWGSLPSNDAVMLLEAISNSFGFEMERTGNHIKISKKREH